MADLTLRHDVTGYLESDGEYARLLALINNSSSSVTAISGPRGAGKSCLARSVAERVANSRGTCVFIPCPTEYAPAEFCVAVLHGLAVSLRGEVERVADEQPSMRESGRRIFNRKVSKSALLFAISPLVGCLIFLLVWLFHPADALRVAHLESLRSSSLQARAQIDSLRAVAIQLGAHDSAQAVVSRELEQEVAWMAVLEDKIREDSSAVRRSTPAQQLIAQLSGGSLWWGVVLAGLSLLASVVGRRTVVRPPQLKMRLEKLGLREKCQNVESRLAYSRTTAIKREQAMGKDWLTSKVSAEESLVDTPLTMSTTIHEARVLLEAAVETYGRVVVVVDELDKISDGPRIEGLLNAMKGMLGVRGTHFVFTLSEEVARPFHARKSTERGVLESVCDLVVPLGRVESAFAHKLLDARFPRVDGQGWSEEVANVVWAVGRGLPREVLRSAISLQLKSLDVGGDPRAVARVLLAEECADLVRWLNARRRSDGPNRAFDLCDDFVQQIRRVTGVVWVSGSDEGLGHVAQVMQTNWHEKLFAPYPGETVLREKLRARKDPVTYDVASAMAALGASCLGVAVAARSHDGVGIRRRFLALFDQCQGEPEAALMRVQAVAEGLTYELPGGAS